MSAYYLKGVAPPELALWTIFKGCFPFLGMVLVTLILVYAQPALVNWLPDMLYSNEDVSAPYDPNDPSAVNPEFLMSK